jgi:hypothetical protein
MNPERFILLALLTAHLLGDFVLQSDEDAKRKKRLLPGALLKHALYIGGASYLLCGDWTLWTLPLLVAGLHLFVDVLRMRIEPVLVRTFLRPAPDEAAPPAWNVGVFLADQALHLLTILVVAGSVSRFSVRPLAPYWMGILNGSVSTLFVLVAGLILATKVGNILIGMRVEPFLSELRRPRGDGPSLGESRGLPDGGKTIGKLERTLIYLFILTGVPQGIGFLVAAKSIFRFGELKDSSNRMEAEYIIIGTLYSFVWGILIAEAIRRVLQMPIFQHPGP